MMNSLTTWVKQLLSGEQDQSSQDKTEVGYNYWSNFDPSKTTIAGDKLNYTVDTTSSDTFTVCNTSE